MPYSQFYVKTNTVGDGSVNVSSGWYWASTLLTFKATPAPGWGFAGWQGSGTPLPLGNSGYWQNPWGRNINYNEPVSVHIGYFSSGGNPFTTVVIGNISETAVFYPGFEITATQGGSVSYSWSGGSGVVQPGQSVVLYVPVGTAITLQATPNSGYTFAGYRSSTYYGYSGPYSGSSNPATIYVTQPTTASSR